jgi:hypothetical protein
MARDADTRENFIARYIQEFGINTSAATALHDVQMLKGANTQSELNNDTIANICKAVSKDTGQSVAKITATKLKLACFWIRHQIRTLREIGGTRRPLVKIPYTGTTDLLQQQKQDKDNWAANNKEPEHTSLTLDTATATNVFDKVKSFSARVLGVTDVPLAYVFRVVLIPEKEKEDQPFGDKTPSIPPVTRRRQPTLLSSPTMLISTTKTPRTLRPMDHLFPPS